GDDESGDRKQQECRVGLAAKGSGRLSRLEPTTSHRRLRQLHRHIHRHQSLLLTRRLEGRLGLLELQRFRYFLVPLDHVALVGLVEPSVPDLSSTGHPGEYEFLAETRQLPKVGRDRDATLAV